MGRRQSDKTKSRLLKAVVALSLAYGLLASYVSYKAIRALDRFEAFVGLAEEGQRLSRSRSADRY